MARLAAATAAVARLDERLAASPEPVRRGFLARLLIEDAAASARLMDHAVDADEVRLADAGALTVEDVGNERKQQAIDTAVGALAVLRAVARRRPLQLFTPRRLIAAARLRLRGRQDLVEAHGVPAWLVEVPDPECCFLLIIFFEKSERQRHCFLNTKATLSLRNQWFNQCFFKESF